MARKGEGPPEVQETRRPRTHLEKQSAIESAPRQTAGMLKIMLVAPCASAGCGEVWQYLGVAGPEQKQYHGQTLPDQPGMGECRAETEAEAEEMQQSPAREPEQRLQQPATDQCPKPWA